MKQHLAFHVRNKKTQKNSITHFLTKNITVNNRNTCNHCYLISKYFVFEGLINVFEDAKNRLLPVKRIGLPKTTGKLIR